MSQKLDLISLNGMVYVAGAKGVIAPAQAKRNEDIMRETRKKMLSFSEGIFQK